MTMTPCTCDFFAEHLADYLERDADVATRAAMDGHVTGCAECAALLADLAAVRHEAAALPVLEPSRDLWSGIAARIETPVVELPSGVGGRGSGAGTIRRPVSVAGRKRRWWAHPALLAAGLVGITAGVTHYATRKSLDDAVTPGQVAVTPAVKVIDTVVVEVPVQVAAGGPESVGRTTDSSAAAGGSPSAAPRSTSRLERAPSIVRPTPDARRLTTFASAPDARRPTADAYRTGELAALDSLYHREILRLRQIIGERRTQLDSTTVSVLERNMTVIDRAIAECRAALAADPASRFLNQQLNEALETKIELMRTAATMPVGS